MKVLWIARLLPAPAHAGDLLYSRGLASSLAAAGVEVSFLGLADPAASAADLAALPPGVDWMQAPGAPLPRWRTLLSRLPLEAKRHGTPAFARLLRARLERGDVDAVVLDNYGVSWALPLLHDRGVPVVAVAQNVETALSRAIARDFRGSPLKKAVLHLNAGRIRRAERRLVRAAAEMVAITEADARAFRAAGARSTLVLTPGYDGPRAPLGPSVPRDRRVVLLGSYRWVAKQMNLRAFLRAADGRFARAGIGLDVVGEVPPALRAELEPGLAATRLLGFVEDPAPVLGRARIGVVPEVTGGGFKLKMLDYIFAGLPVAGLTAALEGLPEAVRRHTLAADRLEGLVELICAAIDDEAALADRARAALEASRDAYDWRTRGRALAEALARVVG